MSESQPRIYKVLLMILPVGVVIGTVIFMFMYFYNERRDEQNHAVIASHGLRLTDLKDMVEKFSDRIGVRDVETEEGRNGLKSAASMIEGRLGPQNVGFPVRKDEGEAAHGLLWKSLWVDVRGKEKPEHVIFAAVSFSGAGEVADANAVSTLMMLASSMARDEPARTIRFVFLPLDRGPIEQNRWLVQRCLNEGEHCDGIIGIQTMSGKPEIGGDEWQAETPADGDEDWWTYLRQGGPRSEGLTQSVWLSHAVFSPETWLGQKERRLEETLDVATQLTSWLRRAAE
ncbi:hypothetical protein NT6N_34510 [Oceaniferula spumae]|uniref:Uncharacterized protein n=1 Tax=Oceaniferula spumae TaxID=2979115 RepID=A0AAT9FQW1_9BACT